MDNRIMSEIDDLDPRLKKPSVVSVLSRSTVFDTRKIRFSDRSLLRLQGVRNFVGGRSHRLYSNPSVLLMLRQARHLGILGLYDN